MADTIIALDISDDLATAVLARKTGRAWSVVDCSAVAAGDAAFAEAIDGIIGAMAAQARRCQLRVSLAAGHFSFRSLTLPFDDAKKIRQVLPGEISEISPFAVEDLEYEFLVAGRTAKGTLVHVAMAERGELLEQRRCFQHYPGEPAVLTITGVPQALAVARFSGIRDFFYLEAGLRRSCLVRVSDGRIHLLRALGFGEAAAGGFSLAADGTPATTLGAGQCSGVFHALARSVRQTILAAGADKEIDGLTLYLGGPMAPFQGLLQALREESPLPVETYSLDFSGICTFAEDVRERQGAAATERALALVLLPERGAAFFNFSRGRRGRPGATTGLARYLRLAAAPALLAAVACVALGWYEYASLAREQKRLDGEIRQVFSRALPDVTRIVDPVQQLKAKVEEARKAYMTGDDGAVGPGMLDLLAEISLLIPPSLQVKVVRLTADQNDIRLRGSTNNYSAVEAIRKGLERSPLFAGVDFSSATQSRQSGSIDFELTIQLRR